MGNTALLNLFNG